MWDETFEGALDKLVGASTIRPEPDRPGRVRKQQIDEGMQATIARAVALLNRYQQSTASGRFEEAGRYLEELSDILGDLEQESVD
jgi:hypothetical protein